jgi:capsular exopolysaccharide synthesis family protein
LELSDYLRLLRRNWSWIACFAILGILLAGAATFATKPTYTAESRLFAAIQGTGSVQELQQGSTFVQARVKSYSEIARTPLVLNPVIESLSLETTAASLAAKVTATTDVNTVLISVTASDESPTQAAAIAQAVSDSLVATVEQLESSTTESVAPVRLTVVTPATAPGSPSAPNTVVNLALGLVVGLTAGLLTSYLRAVLDTRVRGESDLRKVTDAALLGGIAFDLDAQKKPLLTQAPPQGSRAESFRQIRTNLQFAHVGHKSKAVLVTSSVPGEGKSTTATNLAIAIAQGGQSVVLIDADLRRPRVDEYLGLERNAGLTTALIGRADVEDLLQPWGTDELYILTAGQIPPNPSELLGSDAMKQLITRLEQKFDAVIIDAPPLLPVTDAAVLAQEVGGVVLVVGSSKVRLPDLHKSLGNLEMVNADLLGVVFNLLPNKGPDAYAYSYYSYGSVEPATNRVAAEASTSTKKANPDFDEKILGISSQAT